MADSFSSSDDHRGAGELPYAQRATFPAPLKLRLGGELAPVTVCYETYGELNQAKTNAIYVCHAVSGDSHVTRHRPDDAPGWWEALVGPGRAIDTNQYFVVCANVLGGCRGTTGPSSLNPATGRPYGGDFPRVTITDMVELQRRLQDHLGIGRWLAVVGGSMGGMMALEWAIRYPDRVAAAVLMATTHRLSSQAVAFDVVGRNAILKDPRYHDGQYYDQPEKPHDGLAIARMIGHITYLSDRSMAEKFDPDRENPREVAYAYESLFSVGSYLAYQGGRFVERFDAGSYLALSLAMDHFNLGRDYGSLKQALAGPLGRFLVISFSSDWLFPPAHSRELVGALLANDQRVSYLNVESNCGHDGFLLEEDLPVYGPLIAGFLNQAAAGEPEEEAPEPEPTLPPADVRSIYHSPRLDLAEIERLVPAGASVLDLGCGDGRLLARLKQGGYPRLLGVDLHAPAIIRCVRLGLDVVNHDLDLGLASFRDRQFDLVVLSQTLQTVRRPEQVLKEMLRVGRRGIVSFPNFAHHAAVAQLMSSGTVPVTAGLPFPWWRTPNIRFFSLKDFENFCRELGVTIHELVALDSHSGGRIHDDPNRNADLAILVLSRE